MRTLILAALIVGSEWVVINRFTDPRIVLGTLALPALLAALGLARLVHRPSISVVSTRRGGGRR